MNLTNRERVGRSMEALRSGLAPFVSREFTNHYKGQGVRELEKILGWPVGIGTGLPRIGLARNCCGLCASWNEVFETSLGEWSKSGKRVAENGKPLGRLKTIFQRRHAPGLDSAQRLLRVSLPPMRRSHEHETGISARQFLETGSFQSLLSAMPNTEWPCQDPEPQRGTRLYHVYTDRPTNKSTIHTETCRWFLGPRSNLRSDTGGMGLCKQRIQIFQG